MSTIYIIQSKTTKKSYIGQTIYSSEHRWKKHLSQINCKNQCTALYSAIRKYGKDDFIIKEIKNGDFTKKELNDFEKYYIKKYNTLSPCGYNLQTGGGCFTVSEETKEKMSKIMKGRKITWKKKVSLGVKKLWEDPIYRRKQTLQRHEKRGKYRNGIIKPLRLKLSIYEMKLLYNKGLTINQIAKKYNVSFGAIKIRICNGDILRKNNYKNIPTQEIRRLYKNGNSIKFIMEKYNVCFKTIKDRII